MTRLGVGAMEWPRGAAPGHGRAGLSRSERGFCAAYLRATRAEIELEQILNSLVFYLARANFLGGNFTRFKN